MFLCDNKSIFNTLTLKQIFSKTKFFSEKIEHRFSIESTQIENASFPYKSTISEVNVNANRIVSTKRTFHKNGVLSATTLFH